MTVEIIRHGLTALQAEHRYQGWTDAPLSPAGKERLRPSEEVPALLRVSPLLRARQTASILFPKVPQRIVPELKEMHFGNFEGKSASEMETDASYRAWVDGGCEGACPNGESRAQFCERTTRVFEALMDEAVAQKPQSVVIVAHGGTLMAVMEKFALPKRAYFDWHRESGHGVICDCDGWERERRLLYIGETDHNRS